MDLVVDWLSIYLTQMDYFFIRYVEGDILQGHSGQVIHLLLDSDFVAFE